MQTNGGRDWQCRVMADTASTGSGSYAAANYIALSDNATAPSAGNTTLPGELTGGTMDRAQATYAHTNGQATFTLTKQFTSDRTVTVEKIGVFNAAAAGTLVWETLLDASADLKSGDTISIVFTGTI